MGKFAKEWNTGTSEREMGFGLVAQVQRYRGAGMLAKAI